MTVQAQARVSKRGRGGGRRRVAAAAGSVALAAAAAAALIGGPAMAGARPAAARAPLGRAASGWALALYVSGRDATHSRVTLYLTSPAGSKYVVRTWPHGTAWQLEAWSPDGSRAIFAASSVYAGPTYIHQLALSSGKTTTFTLPAFSRVIGYARPGGGSVFVAEDSGIYRYSLTGKRLAKLSAVSGQASNLGTGGVVMSTDGKQIVVPARRGLSLVSPAGVLLRKLPVPDTKGACLPVRWQSAGVVVATCTPRATSAGPRVFEVPVSGGKPVAITAVGSFTSGNYGNTDAWAIAGAAYVQAEQSCGAGYVGRQAADGSISPVVIPGDPESTVVDGVYGHRLLLTETGCENRNALVMFSLATHTARTILPYGHGAGAYDVVPFDRLGTQP